MPRWSLDDISWGSFRKDQVNPDLVVLAKTASLVEFNSGDYTDYLCNIFYDDAGFQEAAREWGAEEKQHGMALAKWAALADPSYNFDRSLLRFREAFHIPVNAAESVRGSRALELVARCVVESGTTSYYTALGEASAEPVFKSICEYIARDEIHHYNLFYNFLKHYLADERLGRMARLKVAIQRSTEVSDEELAFAYAAANLESAIRPELVSEYSAQYLSRGYSVYRRQHLDRALALMLKAAGFKPKSWLTQVASLGTYLVMQTQAQRMTKKRPDFDPSTHPALA